MLRFNVKFTDRQDSYQKLWPILRFQTGKTAGLMDKQTDNGKTKCP